MTRDDDPVWQAERQLVAGQEAMLDGKSFSAGYYFGRAHGFVKTALAADDVREQLPPVGDDDESGEDDEPADESDDDNPFEPKVCQDCGESFGPDRYDDPTTAGKALGGHRTKHTRERERATDGGDGDEARGLDTLFPEDDDE